MKTFIQAVIHGQWKVFWNFRKPSKWEVTHRHRTVSMPDFGGRGDMYIWLIGPLNIYLYHNNFD